MTRLVGVFALFLAATSLLAPLTAGDETRPEKHIEAMFRKLDTNKDGRLSKDEFLKIADRFRDKDKARTELGQTFDKLDPGNKGLTKDQFRRIVETRLKKKDDEAGNKTEK
jgi:Ca2+-binding EF-hand superfamily protein